MQPNNGHNMETIIVRKLNESKLQIECEPSIQYELAEHFCFYVPGYKFTPAYKNKIWDGKIRLFDLRFKTLPVGLLDYLYEFGRAREYNIVTESSDYYSFPDASTEVGVDMLQQFIDDNLTISSGGHVITPHDYQLRAVSEALSNERRLILSPTASGKSLIIYLAIRWFLINVRMPVLIVVPSTSLVEQLASDFADYSEFDESFDADNLIQKIYSGESKKITKPVTITTWQSVYKQPAQWCQKFGFVVGDEAHNFKAKSLTTLMDKCSEARFRMGTTGTLDGTKTHQMVLEGLFGSVYKVITTKELMDRGAVADLKIKALVLKYSDPSRKLVSSGSTKMSYQEEISFITQSQKRNNFIKNLVSNLEGNTLVLFNLVDKHGKPMHQLIVEHFKKKYPNRKVFFVSGKTAVDDREKIRQIVETENDAVIVASLGTFSTGINIKNLHNVVFASPSKSQIKILQSIGRGLRKSDNGRHMELYDIIDDLHWRKRQNYTLKHGAERISIYAKEMFKYKVIEVPFNDAA